MAQIAGASSVPGAQAQGALQEFIERLGSASEEERAALLERSGDFHHRQTVEELHAEVVRQSLVDLDRAQILADAAMQIAQVIHDEYARGLSLRAAGHVMYVRAHYQLALERYEGALAIFERLERDAEVGRTLSSALQTLIYLGLHDQALAWAGRAREIFTRLGDRLRLGRLASNMGNILYRQDRYREALQLYGEAREVLSALGEPRDVAAVLSNMAVCSISLNEFDQAFRHYQEARTWCDEHGMPLLVAEADYNIAYLHYARGEYAQAVGLYEVTREHCARLGDAYHHALCDLDQSELYLELNLSREGADLARKAYRRFEQLAMGYEKAKALTNIAIAASHLGKPAAALRLLRKARRIFLSEKNRFSSALTDLYRALVLYSERRFAESQTLCQRALRFFSRTSAHGKTVLCELLLARLLLESGDRAGARRVCLSALQRVDAREFPSASFHLHFLLGQVEEALQNPPSAYAEYETARQTIETLWARLPGEEVKIAFFKDKAAVYESLVWMCLGQPHGEKRYEEAFRHIEAAKSRSLADQIALHAHALRSPERVREEISVQVQNLRKDLNWYYRQLDLAALQSQQVAVRHIECLRRQTRVCEDELARVLSSIRAADQDFAALQGVGPVPLESIRAALPEDAVLLEYFLARGVVYACVVGRRDLRIVPVAAAPHVRDLLRLLRFQLAKFRLGPSFLRTFAEPLRETAQAHLRELYSELVGPVRPLLRGRHLVVVPHAFLHHLPFHALHDGEAFLADRFTLSYAPSAGVYALCRSKPRRFREQSLVLGIPDEATPYIREEVEAAATALPNARLFLGSEASEAVLKDLGAVSRFVHIATHGVFRQDSPMFSSIRLGRGYLNLADLYQLRLTAEMVTLSGCCTGMNALVGGDELVGLVRGLLYAGAHGVLVSLWDVHDRSTSSFMTSFYRRLEQQGGKAEAMQQAMRELREAHPHPYYWAPFILIGDHT